MSAKKKSRTMGAGGLVPRVKREPLGNAYPVRFDADTERGLRELAERLGISPGAAARVAARAGLAELRSELAKTERKAA